MQRSAAIGSTDAPDDNGTHALSRLDSFIRRMSAQRLLLDHAADLIADLPGPVLDLGIGAGRTYDHLCALFPNREVFAYDSVLQSALGVLPDAQHMIVGDIRDTLSVSLDRIGDRAALIHNDLGSADAVGNAALAAWLAPAVLEVARGEAIVVSSFLLAFPRAKTLALPTGIAPGRYHVQKLEP